MASLLAFLIQGAASASEFTVLNLDENESQRQGGGTGNAEEPFCARGPSSLPRVHHLSHLDNAGLGTKSKRKATPKS